jgi:tRNA uridine 5-carboxymethylaminomethyl modification enzyme
MRLTEIGRQLGVVDDERWRAFDQKRARVANELERLKSTWVNPKIVDQAEANRVLGQNMDREYSLFDLLRRPEITYANLMGMQGAGCAETDQVVAEQVETQVKYQGYIERQKDEIARQSDNEQLKLEIKMDYSQVRGLSTEVWQKLNKHQPETLGQAARISGITPAAISLLLVHIKRSRA